MSSSKRILLLTHQTPFPIRSGGQMYTANVITALHAAPDVKLTVVAIGRPRDMREIPAAIDWHMIPAPVSRGLLRGLIGQYPRSVAATFSRNYRTTVLSLLRRSKWDAVVIDYISIGWVIHDVLRAVDPTSAEVIYMSHNVEATLRKRVAEGFTGPRPLRALALRDARKAARLEGTLVRKSTMVTAETVEDAAEFQALFGAKRVHLYTPGYDGKVVVERPVPLKDCERAIAVIGSRIATMKRLVLDEVLTSIATPLALRDVKLIVAGDAPRDYLETRRQQYPDADFLGFVDDLSSLLETVRIGLITDHIGGGFKHRILSLVFNRVPLMATRQAMAGLPFTPGVHYLAVERNDEVPEAALHVIDDFERLEKMQEAAFEACRTEFNWGLSTARFISALGPLAERGASG